MRTDLGSLDPSFLPLAQKFVQSLADHGVSHCVTSTRRTDDEQIALYAQGRQSLIAVNALRSKAGMPPIDDNENKYTVTNCDGILHKSMHQLGLALDVVPVINGKPSWPERTDPRWNTIGIIGEACGLDWGGRWPGIYDMPHYQRRA